MGYLTARETPVGVYSYWMSNCNAMKEISEYDGDSAMVSHWGQEILGYHFNIFHRLTHMMMHVTYIYCRLGNFET